MQPERLGPYRIGETLGKGGMGSVYRGTHVETGEEVALKALNPQLAISEAFRERFESEIESLQTLRHAGIIRLLGYGEEEGVLFYAMELVEGPSLEEELRNGRRFNWRETAHIAIQVSRALKHAHDHGVVHRDIKPANILLGPRGQVKLADFGIARLFGSSGATIAGGILGTADYMSPEQAAGEPVTARCDQYSLGGVMYALLTGRSPFRAEDLPSMLQLQRYAVAEPVTRYAPDTPRDMAETISQLLEKDPAKRFPNTLVLAKHLEAMTRALRRPGDDDFEVYDAGAPVRPANPLEGITLAPTQVAPITTRGESPSRSDEGFSSEDARPTEDPSPSVSLEEVPAGVNDLPSSDVPGMPSPTRYTTITYEPTKPPPAWRPLAGQAMVLAVAISMIGGMAWWWLRPVSADKLYQRLEAANAQGDTDSTTRSEAQEFLDRFPHDPRAEEVVAWSDAIELSRLKKRIALERLGGLWRSEGPAAEEILHRRISQMAAENPQQGTAAFSHLADLLEGPSSPSTDARRRKAYAELARREADQLQTATESEEKLLAEFGKERLVAAQRLRTSSPAEARRIATALVRLIPRSDTTQPVLEEAQQLLRDLNRSR